MEQLVHGRDEQTLPTAIGKTDGHLDRRGGPVDPPPGAAGQDTLERVDERSPSAIRWQTLGSIRGASQFHGDSCRLIGPEFRFRGQRAVAGDEQERDTLLTEPATGEGEFPSWSTIPLDGQPGKKGAGGESTRGVPAGVKTQEDGQARVSVEREQRWLDVTGNQVGWNGAPVPIEKANTSDPEGTSGLAHRAHVLGVLF